MARPLPAPRDLLFALVGGGLVALASASGLLAPFDLPVGDLLLPLRPGPGAEDAPVAAVVLDDAALAALGPLPWPRDRLAALLGAITEAGARGVAVDLLLADATGSAEDAALAAALDRQPAVLAAALRDDGGWLLPLARLGGAARAGHAEAEVGPDGVVRSVLATKQRGDLALPALSLAAARLVRPSIPIAPGTELRPDFALPPARVPRIGAAALLGAGPAGPPVRLDGRLVFVGTTATGSSDQFVVPVGGLSPGVLVHAAAASSILEDGLLRPAAPWFVVLGCLALALAAQVARDRSGRVRLAHFAAAGALLLAAGTAATVVAGLRLPLVSFAAAFGVSALLREVAESRQAQADTGHLLQRLLDEPGEAPAAAPAEGGASPRGAAGRLALARRLQEQVIGDRDLRRALLDSLADGVLRFDRSGRLVLANAAAAVLWGADPGSDPALAAAVAAAPTGAGVTVNQGLSPTKGVWAELASARAGAGVTVRRGGRELRLTVRRLEDGASLAVLRDVSAEAELESRRREMQRLVSHELKTPLASIASFGGMLERYRFSDEELARIAGLVRGESERLLDMVTTFLDLERLGSGRWEAAREPVDLWALARQRAEVLAAAAEARGSTLALGREPSGDGRCAVAGDPKLLARVVDNLVGNAVKYSPEGCRIELAVRRAGGRVELAVTDRGPGIAPEALPHLFERFYRAGPADAGGSGLGLALVREIATWHDGCVDVESEPGRGSVFTVRLPALDPDPAGAPRPAAPAAGEGDTG